MASSFEKYLYTKFRAVYLHGLSELATNINLLDVLIKTDTQGIFPPRPVVKRSGSMIALGTESSAAVQNRLRQGLTRFEEDRGDELFKWTSEEHHVHMSFASAKSLSGSILAGPLVEVEAHLSDAKTFSCRLEDLSTACVDKDKLVEYVTENQWKPNVDDRRLKWPDQPNCTPISGRGGRKLWVIHQILYASKLVVTSGASASAGAKACTIVPGPPGAGVSVSRDSGPNTLDLTVGTNSKFPGKFMFAFRALCFRFDAAGELVSEEDDAGSVMPIHRGDDEGPYDDERAQIRDLFLEEPPEVYSDFDDEEEEDWDVHRLPIEGFTD